MRILPTLMLLFGAGLTFDSVEAQNCAEAAERDCNTNGLPDSYDLDSSFFFADRITVDSGGDPSGTIAADLDRDGLPDLVAARSKGKAVTISWNNFPDELFTQTPDVLPVGGDPLSLTAADLDGDGDLDLAVAVKEGATTGHIAIFRNLGDGTFGDPDRIPLDSIPRFILAEDLNGDGLPDLALSREGISVLLNRGGAAFDSPLTLAAGSLPQGLAAADLDGDGRVDLAAANEESGDISVHIGRGDGTFEPRVRHPVGTGPLSVVAVDFDGDQAPDLAVTCWESREIVILRNDGGGQFQVAVRVHQEWRPFPLKSLDVDGDGDIDLITTIWDTSDPPINRCWVVVLRNDGAGGFREAVRVHYSRHEMRALAVADFDGEGRPDFGVTRQYPDPAQSGILVFYNIPPPSGPVISQDCNSNCIPDECEADCNRNGLPDDCDISQGILPDCNRNGIPDSCEIGQGILPDCNGNGVPDACDIAGGTSGDCNRNGVPDGCEIGQGILPDCNGNGVPDACEIAGATSADCNGNGIPDECDLLRQPGFPGGTVIPQPEGGIDAGMRSNLPHLVAADLDGDGLVDLASLNGDGISVVWNEGARRFSSSVKLPGGEEGSASPLPGDFDGDGLVDLMDIRLDGKVHPFFHEAPREFWSGTEFSLVPGQEEGGEGGVSVTAWASSDFNGDGNLDFAVTAGDSIVIAQNFGSGIFILETLGCSFDDRPDSLVAGDLDGDGTPDLAAAACDGARAYFNVNGFRAHEGWLPSNGCIRGMGLGDLNGDGGLDVIYVSDHGEDARRLDFLWNEGGGLLRLGRPSLLAPSLGPVLATGDLDGDGDKDMVSILGSGFGILANNGRGIFQIERHITGSPPIGMALADLDEDGDPDLALAGSDPPGGEAISVIWNDSRPRSLDSNGDHIPDECEGMPPPVRFNRGDANADGVPDLSDAIGILFHLFLGEPLHCMKAADVDDSGSLDLTDAICLLGYMFLGEAAPEDPFRACGWDPTPDGLSCERFMFCQ